MAKKRGELAAVVIVPFLYLASLFLSVNCQGGFDLDLRIKALFLVLAYIGLIFWIVSYFNLGRAFGVLPGRKKMIMGGLYRFFPHPMYFGIFATLLSLSLLTGSIIGFLYNVFFLLPLLSIRAFFESKKLIKD